MFKALLTSKSNDGTVKTQLEEVEDSALTGDTLVEISYSSINYKDALAVSGKPGVIRDYPLIAGIDLVGVIKESGSDELPIGTEVTVNGWGIGENSHGGYAQLARVSSDWLVKLPTNLSSKQAAQFGTAGYTAALAVLALQEKVTTEQGEIAVTGGNGGVGGIALGLLKNLGYQTVAVTSRLENSDYLKALGAARVIGLDELNDSDKPLQKTNFAGAIDSLGGKSLANLIAQTDFFGLVASCGLAESAKLDQTVMPFILRGVTLAGINSVYAPLPQRQKAWQLLAENASVLQAIEFQTISLAEVPEQSEKLLAAKARGRFLVKISD